jgi:ferrous iron transport protein B
MSSSLAEPIPQSPPVGAPEVARVALVGNPNTGKTTLFNHLCGLRAKTANFPGTTTDARIGRCGLGEGPRARGAEVVDLPGLYRLHLDLPESRVCRGVLEGEGLYRRPEAVVVVVDATNLVRNLYLVGEVLAYALPTVVALNMTDIARRQGLSIDPEQLSRRLGCPVVPLVARRGEGVDALRREVDRALEQGLAGEGTGPWPEAPPTLPDAGDFEALDRWAESVFEGSVGGAAAVGAAGDSVTARLDQAFTHPVLGVAVFALIMGGLFWTLFALATVPMDLIEVTFEHLGGWVAVVVPAGAIHDLLVDGIIGGIAGTVVFLPQICLLFFLISLLEDTGYLARAAFVMDRILCRFGLPGQAFVPLLSSHACALPGILSTKLIPDRDDRLATILVAPFMSCSARLPVYVLLTSLLFAERPLLAGLAFAGCYLLGATAALGSAWLARSTFLKGRSRPMVLELPSYKLPSLRTAAYTAYFQGMTFLRKAGTVIVGICVVMWWLSAYPQVEAPHAALELRSQAAAAASAEQAEALQVQADFLEARHAQAYSFAGRLGRTFEPVFAPLGFDWQLTVGVLTSFLAREVFVSTMAVLLVGGEAVEEQGVIDEIRTAVRDDGSPVFTPAASASLLVFFVLAMQCLPTLAVTRKEAGGFLWAGLQLLYMSGLAWIAAFATFHGLHLLGVA